MNTVGAVASARGSLKKDADVRGRMRAIPYPYHAVLAICSDLDETPDAATYQRISAYLNSTQNVEGAGRGVGLEVGNTIYFNMDPAQFAYWNADDQGRAMVRTLIQSGHIDCLHSFGDLATTRRSAALALEELERHRCRVQVWIDHATAITNFGADIMRGEGDLPGAAAYHADLTLAYGVRWIWTGRVTSVSGQSAPRRNLSVVDPRFPLASARTLAKEVAKQGLAHLGQQKYAMHRDNRLTRIVPLRDGQRATEFIRYDPNPRGLSVSDTGPGIADVITTRALDALERSGGLAILYTHLGKGATAAAPVTHASRAAFERLAERSGSRILVTTTARTLRYAYMRDHVVVRLASTGHGLDVHVTSDVEMPPDWFQGLTVYVPDPARARLFLNGVERTIQRNPADASGRPSVSVPWMRLEFPQL